MHHIYLVCVWLHLIAVATWLGGMLFLAAIVLPVVRRGGPAAVGEFMCQAATRLRVVGWGCLAILGATGWAQLEVRGLAWNANAVVLAKITIYFTIVAISLLHDFGVGPRASAAMRAAPDAPITKRWRRAARGMGQLTALLALMAVLLGIVIVRGAPW